MLKELLARVALLVLIFGVTNEVAREEGNSGQAKQRLSSVSKDAPDAGNKIAP